MTTCSQDQLEKDQGLMASGEIHLPLSVKFPADPKVRRLIRFGADSRALRDLYVQMCLYCKDNLSDGFVPDEELGILVYPDTAENGERDAQRLAEVNLVQRVDGGYYVPGYVKRNKTKAEVQEKLADKATGGAIGNHRRWHLDRGIVKPGCRYCTTSRPPSQASSDRSADPPPEHTADIGAQPPAPPEAADQTGTPPSPSPDDAAPWPTESGQEEVEDPAADPPFNVAALVAEVRAIRPDWTAASIRRALDDERVRERPASRIPAAMLAVAGDAETVAPGRLANNGPWWRPPAPQLAVVPEKCPDCNPFRHLEDSEGRDLGRCPRCHPSVAEKAS